MTKILVRECACTGYKTVTVDDRSESMFLACICANPELTVTLDVDTAGGVGYPVPVPIVLVHEGDDDVGGDMREEKSPKYEPADDHLDMLENIGRGPREGT